MTRKRKEKKNVVHSFKLELEQTRHHSHHEEFSDTDAQNIRYKNLIFLAHEILTSQLSWKRLMVFVGLDPQ